MNRTEATVMEYSSPVIAGHVAERQNNFDFLRFLLAAGVIFSHSFSMQRGRDAEPLMRFSKGQIEFGSLAVDGFFILSGYLIAQSFEHSKSVGDYLRKRVLRIYPGFVVAAVVSLLLFGPVGSGFDSAYWHKVQWLKFFARLPALKTLWIPNSFKSNFWPYVNAPPWTIQYEFVCYVLITILGAMTLLRRRAALLALWILLYSYSAIQFPLKLWIYNWNEMRIGGQPDYYPRFFTYFLAGTLFYLYRDRVRFNAANGAICAVAIVVAMRIPHALDAVLPLGFSYLLLAFAFSPRIRLHNWAQYGDFSYGLYLYGWPVLQTIIMFTHARVPPMLLFVLAMTCTLPIAVGSWYLIERPFLRLKR
jgi:peptidoglycan/LPS O-acetylase OafA/YrhL